MYVHTTKTRKFLIIPSTKEGGLPTRITICPIEVAISQDNLSHALVEYSKKYGALTECDITLGAGVGSFTLPGLQYHDCKVGDAAFAAHAGFLDCNMAGRSILLEGYAQFSNCDLTKTTIIGSNTTVEFYNCDMHGVSVERIKSTSILSISDVDSYRMFAYRDRLGRLRIRPGGSASWSSSASLLLIAHGLLGIVPRGGRSCTLTRRA